MKTPPRTRQILTYLVGSLAFLALPYVFTPQGIIGKLALLRVSPHEQTNLIGYLLMLAFMYLNYYVLIPRFYFLHRYTFYASALIVGFLLIGSVMAIRDRHDLLDEQAYVSPPLGRSGQLMPPPYPMPPSGFSAKPFYGFELSQALFLFLVGVFVTLSLRVSERWRQTEQERIATELSFLKAQINPHFLFNTLNSIYALAIEQSPNTADAVVKLSSFMRYVTRDTGEDWVPLQRELDYIGQYVDLQRLRLADTATVSYAITGPTTGLQIAPLLLISFIENAFKYGVNPAVGSPIDIRADVQHNQLQLHVHNQKVRQATSTSESGGLGLTNTRTRLDMLYPGRHTLTINDQPNTFTVDLTIQLV